MNTRDKLKEMLGLLDVRYFNAPSTIRTSLGFVKSLFSNNQDSDRTVTLDSIFNYLPINDRITTSGQPQAAHFPLIRAAGFETVLNLAPHGAENALPDEAQLVAATGMTYVHIPVAFDNPTEDDFTRFQQVLEQSPQQKIYVHCAANMRVSAFVYRYRTQVLQEDAAVARLDLQRMWKPFGVWADFIGD